MAALALPAHGLATCAGGAACSSSILQTVILLLKNYTHLFASIVLVGLESVGDMASHTWLKYTLILVLCLAITIKLLVWNIWERSSPPGDLSEWPEKAEIRSHILAANRAQVGGSKSSGHLGEEGQTNADAISEIPPSQAYSSQWPFPPPEPALQDLQPLMQPPLSTSGRYIVDSTGARIKLVSVNWYGASDELFIPGGLDIRHRDDIARTIRSLGFNSVRLPYSDELVVRRPKVPARLIAANADLLPLGSDTNNATHHGEVDALSIYHAAVEALTRAGLAVIINNHITTSRWCCDGNLCDSSWYNTWLPPNSPLNPFSCPLRQSEDDWIDNWVTIMRPHISNPLVVGADLRNEPRGPTNGLLWFSWAPAAERAAAALHALNPDWLMIVEGVCSANDLSNARTRPVHLEVENKLVYSAHVYGWSGWGSLQGAFWYRRYESFSHSMYENFGYLLETQEAPVWVGEMGAPGVDRGRDRDGYLLHDDTETTSNSTHTSPSKRDLTYWTHLIRYLEKSDADFAYWAINPRKPHDNEYESYGLLEDDWETVRWDYRLWDMAKLAESGKRGKVVDE